MMKSSVVCFVAFVVILLNNIRIALSDISDDECGIFHEFESNKLSTLNSTDNAAESLNRSKNELYRRAVPKKSLIIIFDGTGSMGDDLIGLGGAAKEIVNFLSKKEENVIEDYIFAVFRNAGKIVRRLRSFVTV